MCGHPPGARCAADTRGAATQACEAYWSAHPSGADLDPVARAHAIHDTRAAAPVALPWARRRGTAPDAGTQYVQHLEPAGRYVTEQEAGGSYPSDLYDTGTATYRSLTIPFGGDYADRDNWKRALSAHYGNHTGRDLSNAIVEDGYDAVITYDKYGTSEVVDLTALAAVHSWTSPDDARRALLERHPGLRLALHRAPSGHVVLSSIVLPPDQRGHGVGDRILADLTTAADRNGWAMALTPSSDFGGSKTKLTAFYKRHGFTANTGRSRDLTTCEAMIRQPRAATVAA